jgi:hypothetical protein
MRAFEVTFYWSGNAASRAISAVKKHPANAGR